MVGNVVSQALSISQVLGEGIATEPNTTISTLLMMAGVTLLVTMGVHIEAIAILVKSFDMFPLGRAPNLDGMAYWLTHKGADAISMGITLALPFIVLNFVYNAILGFLNRAMPQLMVSLTVFSALTSLFTYPDNIGQDILLSRDGSVFKGIVAKTGLGILPVFALPFCLLITVISGIFFADAFFTLPSLAAMPAIMLIEEIKIVIVKLLFYMIGAMTILTLIDLPYGQFAHLKKLRMTLQEIRDENKDSEGDPHMKSARRSRAMAISQGSMMKDVATADVIIVNPTHYAVALKWSRAPGSAPTCVAKGVDNIALQIRQKAGALVEIGEIIHPEHFAAVAAAIHFADQLKPKSY